MSSWKLNQNTSIDSNGIEMQLYSNCKTRQLIFIQMKFLVLNNSKVDKPMQLYKTILKVIFTQPKFCGGRFFKAWPFPSVSYDLSYFNKKTRVNLIVWMIDCLDWLISTKITHRSLKTWNALYKDMVTWNALFNPFLANVTIPWKHKKI